MNSRRSITPPLCTLDSALTGRISNACWFLAAWGVAIFLAALLARVWNQDQHATRTACIASAWILGTVFGLHISYSLRRTSFAAAPLWGAGYLSCALGWLVLLPPALWPRSALGPVALWESALALSAVSFLMSATSTCWLGHRRPWPGVEEPAILARGLIALTLGLFVAWTLPEWAGLIGLALLVPLFVLDLYPAARSPFPQRGGEVDSLLERSGGDPAAWLPLQLERHGHSRWWWLSYLVRRKYIPPTLLAISLSVVTGAIWYSVPTLFAANLVRSHQVWTLGWLVAGQLVALAVGGYVFGKSRGIVGAPDRLIPQQWQRRSWRVALAALFLMAASLVMLGLPFLQAPWELALSLACYTLAGAVWTILLPRLRPSITTQVYSLRHVAVSEGSAISVGQLAFERAHEDRVTLILATWEGVLTAITAPVFGYLIDRTTFDVTLVVVGLALFLFFAAVLLVLRLTQSALPVSTLAVGETRA